MKLAVLALLVPLTVAAQSETRELVGQMGSRPALLVLKASRNADGAWQLAGAKALEMVERLAEEGEGDAPSP